MGKRLEHSYIIEQAYAMPKFNVKLLAKQLGVSRDTISNHITRHREGTDSIPRRTVGGYYQVVITTTDPIMAREYFEKTADRVDSLGDRDTVKVLLLQCKSSRTKTLLDTWPPEK